jgi:hypothetical protein
MPNACIPYHAFNYLLEAGHGHRTSFGYLRLGWICHIIPISLLSLPQAIHSATTFSTEGLVRHSTPFYEERLSFRMTLDGDAWNVRMLRVQMERFPQKRSQMPGIQFDDTLGYRYEASCDGRAVYYLSGPPAAFDAAITNSFPTGAIANGAVPYGITDYRLMLLWYLFGSRQHLAASRSNLIISPLVHAGAPSARPSETFYRMAFWRTADLAGGFPAEIAFTTFSQSDLANAEVGSARLSTNCTLRVLESTNVGGFAFPRQAHVQIFRQHSTGHSGRASVQQEIEIVTTNVVLASLDPTFVLALPKPAVISDLRVLAGTNAKPAKAVSMLLPAWPDTRHLSKHSIPLAMAQDRTPVKSALILVCFGFLALLPVCLVVRKLIQTKNNQP